MGHIVQAVTVPWYNACADYAIMLARGLRIIGHRVTVAGGAGTPAMAKAREYGFDVLDRGTPASSNPFSLAALIREYRRFALENGVSVVNVHHGRDHLPWALALRGTGIALVRTSGNQIPPNAHIASRYLMRRCTAGMIASCGTVRGYYTRAFGFDPGEIPVINGGVDCARFSPEHPRNLMRGTLGIPDDAFLFGIIGRFSPVKGHRYFFEAAREVLDSFPDTWFVASGGDAQCSLADMRALVEKAGIAEHTRLIGRQDDIRALIASLDAGVIASTGSETVCRIAMEYLAMGIPVVAADTNVVPEVIRHGENGFVVPAANADAMAAAMRQLAENPERGVEMGRAGRGIAEREFSLERFAVRTDEAYRMMSADV